MGAKKKGGKKKGKGKKGKKLQVVQEETGELDLEYDNMDLEMLQEVVPMLKQQLEKSMLDRNYVQLERDTVQTFYDITQREVKDLELKITAKDRETELMEDNHRVEVRVYVQKVKHLEYEHQNNVESIENEGKDLLGKETDLHGQRSSGLERSKKGLKSEVEERHLIYADEISQVKKGHVKTLTKMREEFETNLTELRARCDAKLAQLEEDLELRRKVGIHEIEERKNLHINDLMRNHEKAFGQTNAYYNDITNDNLKLIRSLKDELVEMRKKAFANQKLMQDISHENKRLSEPLKEALADVAELHSDLKDREKDRMSLTNAKARLKLKDEQLSEVRDSHRDLKTDFAKVVEEREQVYDTFEGAVKAVQQRSDFRNLALEQRMNAVEQSIEKAETQLTQIVEAAKLDPEDVDHVMSGLEEVLTAKNAAVRDLHYAFVRTAKSYNDSLRTYSAKLEACGVPAEEIDAMGFAPVATSTSLGPAGLVAR
ncbi:unnamed protein product [Ascophyllum nodosum]